VDVEAGEVEVGVRDENRLRRVDQRRHGPGGVESVVAEADVRVGEPVPDERVGGVLGDVVGGVAALEVVAAVAVSSGVVGRPVLLVVRVGVRLGRPVPAVGGDLRGCVKLSSVTNLRSSARWFGADSSPNRFRDASPLPFPSEPKTWS
jgi:hypothetical protein